MLRLLVLAGLATCTLGEGLEVINKSNIKLNLVANPRGGLSISLNRNGRSDIISVVGTLAGDVLNVTQTDDGLHIRFSNDTTLSVTSHEVNETSSGHVVSLSWRAPKTMRLVDCVSLATSHWYGGPQQKGQYWPIEKLQLSEYSYLTKEADNCGIAEPYWLSSDGIFYFIDRKSPLFVDQNNQQINSACFIADVKAPYSSLREQNTLDYDIGIFSDVRKAHEYAVESYLKKPTGYPDETMIKYPIWSTWAKYKTNINHDVVIEFADEITQHGFPNSQFEIDDLWEVCYGSQTVDVNRFPDMKNTVDTLKGKGYRVTIWTHPFLNKGCEPWYSDALSKSYLISSESGSVETSWWNDNGTTSAYLDFTKAEVQEWYSSRLRTLQSSYGIDSFKFDAGETSWSPQIPVLQGNASDHPNVITEDYVRTVAKFGSLVEVRSGSRTQDLPIFVRMIDKDTYWTFENGLPTLVTTLLQMNLNGYSLVLPDMIGGNGYNEPPSKELFLRWLQANTFMPSLQFSYVPWDFDNETITISKKFVDLHAEYTPAIIEVCKLAVKDGAPVNAPVWWVAPDDVIAHEIWDQYLLGEDILVAPVLTEGATSRDIYLPAGRWSELGDEEKIHEGPIWLMNFSAPLDVLPFFVRESEPNAATAPFVAVILVLFGMVINILNIM